VCSVSIDQKALPTRSIRMVMSKFKWFCGCGDVKIYICEYCGEIYISPTEAEQCEIHCRLALAE